MDSSTINPRCQIGDLALVTRSAYPENVGRVVRIVRSSGPDECYDCRGGGTIWWVRSDGGPLRQCYEDMTTDLTQERCMDDANLLPIWWETNRSTAERRDRETVE